MYFRQLYQNNGYPGHYKSSSGYEPQLTERAAFSFSRRITTSLDYFAFLPLRMTRTIPDSYSRLHRASRTVSLAIATTMTKHQAAARRIPRWGMRRRSEATKIRSM